MPNDFQQLQTLGWTPWFSTQLSLDELEQYRIGRVIGAERDRWRVDCGDEQIIAVLPGQMREQGRFPVIGDWLLLQWDTPQIVRLLERQTLLQRARVGAAGATQAIAANVDTVVIVAAMGEEFNAHRIERYLLLAFEAGAETVTLLTKRDLIAEPDTYLRQAEAIRHIGPLFAVDAIHDDIAELLQPWLTTGATLVLAGSSGVGKSTLLNNLCGREMAATGSVRHGDEKGRHTTTSRSLVQLPSGACLIDVPGMREVGLPADETIVEQGFDDITDLAHDCRFADCSHQGEPGCAVAAAIEQGRLSEERLEHYLRLQREVMHQIESRDVHLRRQRERGFSKMVRSVQKRRKQDSGKA